MRKTTTSTFFEPLESRRMMDGTLDPSFDYDGIRINIPTFVVVDTAIQADGKIVVAGTKNVDFAVARLLDDGRMDPSFGVGGRVYTSFFADAEATSLGIQSDGKIVVGGDVKGTHIAVARYRTDGTLDATFDGDGLVVKDLGLRGSDVNDLAIQRDGRIVLVGRQLSLIDDDFLVARLLSNGSLDSTFGKLRDVRTGVRSGYTNIGFGGNSEEADVVVVQADGRIVVGGDTGGEIASFNSGYWAIARLLSNGTLDSTFDGDGKKSFSTLLSTAKEGLFVQADGKIVIDYGDDTMRRLQVDGRLDPTFGANGSAPLGLWNTTILKTPQDQLIVTGQDSELRAVARRFNANGLSDGAFGALGTSRLPRTDIWVNTAAMDAAGRLVMAGGVEGGSAMVARLFDRVPRVTVHSLDPNASEPGTNTASLLFMRDQRYNFPTRVYYNLGGTAAEGFDYGQRRFRGAPPHFVDIPAGENSAFMTIRPHDDLTPEPKETIIATLVADPRYTVGERSSQTLKIADNDTIRVNFQDGFGYGPDGYVPDVGNVFGNRSMGLQYGWDANNTANARRRNHPGSPDIRYDTLNHLQKDGANRKWEIALPNGMYEVRLVAGDPSARDSVFRMDLEGTNALSGTPSGNIRWFRSTVNVMVSDGRLTLTNGAGAINNKICFIDIKASPEGATPGPVSGNIAVDLVTPGTIARWRRLPSGLFSDTKIDELIWN